MGKNAQRKRVEQQNQPQIDHFTMSGDAYVAIRRYLGSRPHDECRELIMHLEQMPAVTADDIALREKQAARLAELEERADTGVIVVDTTRPDYDVIAELEALDLPPDDAPVANHNKGEQ